MSTIDRVLDEARKMVGVQKYSSAHKQLVDEYNAVKPLPVGYEVTYDDDWCDVFITTIFIRANASNLIGRECGVDRHIEIFKNLGIWNEDGRVTPKRGDIITFNWDDSDQPNDGFADHIGIVEKVEGSMITTIEGNANSKVMRKMYQVGNGYIRGYARPKYSNASHTLDSFSQPTKKWTKDLTYGGNRLPAEYINILVDIGNKYHVLPSFLITQLYVESNWGASPVALADNNLAGMTWNGNPNRPSGVLVQKGSPRPVNEGGHYIRYQSISDFFKDWSYLYRPNGPYNINNKNFEEAIKGLFTIGGAKANYATSGYTHYYNLMTSVKAGIERENGINVLKEIDGLHKTNHSLSNSEYEIGDYYTVVPGDSLWAIAQYFGLTIDELCELNNITTQTIIHPGDKLLINKRIQHKPSKNQTEYYTVVSGDSLWAIAHRFGITLEELCQLNEISSDTIIHPGDRLIIRKREHNPSQSTTVPSESLVNHYAETGRFTANQALNIRNHYSTNSSIVEVLYAGESVIYDSVYITTRYVYISYIAYSGHRRYIAIRTYNHGNYGTIWGNIE